MAGHHFLPEKMVHFTVPVQIYLPTALLLNKKLLKGIAPEGILSAKYCHS